MAKLSHTDSRRMYSWWWDSHISPKNSKWLQENLTDMDVKVKSMIKLLEVDEDSFARRAEMYYKKRPELMRMVEEFYRAYRALAERYDHATAVIRHAHRTMPEAFPNQAPTMFVDESPASSFSGADSVTPDLPTSMGQFTDESNNGTRIMTKKPFKDSFRPFEQVRRGLNFDEAEDEEESVFSNGDNHAVHLKSSKLDQESNSKEITAFKEALVTLEAEKESNLQDYQKCLDKITELQTAVSTVQDDAQKLNERANSAEIEAQKLKNELEKLSVEKDAALDKYMQSLEIISSLENKMHLAEEDSSRFKKRAESAESEVESLRQVISELTEEKETAALQYQRRLEIISSLEQKLALANEEAKRLNGEIEDRDSKLQVVEEQRVLLERSNLSLQSKLESLTLKMETQSQELAEKQKEHGRLWACVQQERLQFVDGETAFQTLQRVHAQTQEELRAMASELQSSARVLKDAETRKQSLQDEVVRVKEENKHLDEMNASSVLLIKDMQNQISSLTESKEEFEEEVDKRNALQQEIYCLKEELNDQNGLRTQLAAFGPEIVSLKKCISTLEDQIDMHIKFQNPKYEELQGSEGSENPSQSLLNEDNKVLTPVSELHDLRVRLQAIVKAAVEIKEIMVHENTHLQSKLDESTRRIELLQSEFGLHRRNMRPTSQTTEEDSALLTKDIVLDQISDSSYRYSKKEAADMDNQIVELWDSSLNKLDISKRSTDSFQEGNKKKVLQRIDSDVQKLTNLQITVQDLKTKLEATEKDKRGKAVIECEALKRQLEEADMAIVKLFHLNGRLTKTINDKSFSDMKSPSDFEGEGDAKRRRVSEQARRMSEKIGRLQLEVQNLQFVLLKLDNKNEGRSTASETRRRVILRDYLYGVGGRTGQRRRKTQFCACVQPSTLED